MKKKERSEANERVTATTTTEQGKVVDSMAGRGGAKYVYVHSMYCITRTSGSDEISIKMMDPYLVNTGEEM